MKLDISSSISMNFLHVKHSHMVVKERKEYYEFGDRYMRNFYFDKSTWQYSNNSVIVTNN